MSNYSKKIEDRLHRFIMGGFMIITFLMLIPGTASQSRSRCPGWDYYTPLSDETIKFIRDVSLWFRCQCDPPINHNIFTATLPGQWRLGINKLMQARKLDVCRMACWRLKKDYPQYNETMCYTDRVTGVKPCKDEQRPSIIFTHRCKCRRAGDINLSFTQLCMDDIPKEPTTQPPIITSMIPNRTTPTLSMNYTVIHETVLVPSNRYNHTNQGPNPVNSTPIIVGVTVGVFGLGIIALAVSCVLRRRRNQTGASNSGHGSNTSQDYAAIAVNGSSDDQKEDHSSGVEGSALVGAEDNISLVMEDLEAAYHRVDHQPNQ